MNKTKTIFIFILLLLISNNNILYAQFQQPESKSYKLQYRLTEDLIPLIRALLSKKGQIIESKEMNMVIIKDFPVNIEKVDSLISQNDKPLKQVIVTVQLFLCSKIEGDTVSSQFKDIKTLTDGFYDFNSFENIDRAIIITQENSPASFTFAGEKYSISFTMDYVEEKERMVKFRNLTLMEVDKDIRGKIEKMVFETTTKIPDNTQIILSAAKYKNTEKTLVVIVGVKIS